MRFKPLNSYFKSFEYLAVFMFDREGTVWSSPSVFSVPSLGDERTLSMDIENDPRFFSDTVIDKRITAFASLSLVSGIMAGASVDQCFDVPKDFRLLDSQTWYKIDVFSGMQLTAFALMCGVLVLNVFTTLVFAMQFYFTIRLMTVGATGFESAKSFYLDERMTHWRHHASKALMCGMVMFLVAVGLMLFSKVRIENSDSFHTVSWVTLLIFLLAAGSLYRISVVHQKRFEQTYHEGHHRVSSRLSQISTDTHTSIRHWW